MPRILTIVGRILPPAFVLFLFVDLSVNPDIPRLGTSNGTVPEAGKLTPEESRALLAQSRKLLQEGKDLQALQPALKLSSIYPENYIYSQTVAEIYDRLGRYKEEAEYWEKFLQYAPLRLRDARTSHRPTGNNNCTKKLSVRLSAA